MPMPALRPITTIDLLQALPEDGQCHELLDGVHAVTPSPSYSHQDLVGTLFFALRRAVEGRADLKVMTSPADIILGSRTLVQPDLFVLQIDPARPPAGWHEIGIPLLAIEVLSPSTAARDRGTKRRIYQAAGVGEYWVVDPDARIVERWTPVDHRPEILDDTLIWRQDGNLMFELPLASLFGPDTSSDGE